MAKYLLIGAIVISIATAILGFQNHSTLVATKATLADTEGSLASTKSALAKSQADGKKLTADLAAANTASDTANSAATAAKNELSKTQTNLETATKAVAEKDAKIADLEKQLADIANRGPENGPQTTPQQVVDQLNQQIKELTAQVDSLHTQLSTANDKLAIFEKKEQERATKTMQEGLEGRVLAVNPAWNFVVLSIGDKQGVVNNAELLLKRSGQYLGKVRITSVEPATSIADIVANTLPSGVAVQPGDSVIFQKQN